MRGEWAGVVAAGIVALAAAGYGGAFLALLRRWFRWPAAHSLRVWMALTIGLGITGHLLVAAGLARILNLWTIRAVLAVGIILALLRIPSVLPRLLIRCTPMAKPPRTIWGALLCAAAGVALLSLLPAAAMPPLAYDVLEYHLQAPRLFLADGSLDGSPTNFFTRLPLEAEMLYLAGHAIAAPTPYDDRAAKWIAAGWVILFAWGAGEVGRRLGLRRAGRWAVMALAAALPLSGGIALDALNDAAAGVFVELAALGLIGMFSARRSQRAACSATGEETDRPRGTGAARPRGDIALAALGAGFALSCKWSVLPNVIFPALVALVVFGIASGTIVPMLRKAAIFGVCALAVFSPWMIRGAVIAGNPVFPWAARWFPTQTWGPEHEQFLVATHRPQRPWQARYWSKVASGLHRILPATTLTLGTGADEEEEGVQDSAPRRTLLLPFGLAAAVCVLLSRRRGPGAWMLLWGVLGLLAWAGVGHAPDRFLFPMAGVFVPLVVLGVGAVRRRSIPVGRIVAWILCIGLAAGAAQDQARRWALYASAHYFSAFGNDAAREELRAQLLGRPMILMQQQVETELLRRGGKALVLYEARGLLFPPDAVLNTVFDKSPLLDWIAEAQTPEEIDAALRAGGISLVVLNEIELHRLVTFYPPLDSARPHPFRSFANKPPLAAYPYLDYYRPYDADPRYPALRDALTAWHARLLQRASWRHVGANGLTLCITPLE